MGLLLAFFDFYLKFLVYIGKNTKGQTNSLKIEKNMDISFLRGKIMNFADFLIFSFIIHIFSTSNLYKIEPVDHNDPKPFLFGQGDQSWKSG